MSEGITGHFGTMYGLKQYIQAQFMLLRVCFMGMLSNPSRRIKRYALNKIQNNKKKINEKQNKTETNAVLPVVTS